LTNYPALSEILRENYEFGNLRIEGSCVLKIDPAKEVRQWVGSNGICSLGLPLTGRMVLTVGDVNWRLRNEFRPR